MGMPMVGYRWRLCHGEGVPEDKSEAARALWDAKAAGTVVPSPPEPPPPSDPPSMARRALNLIVATAKHVSDGMKQRSQEEIEALLTNHCQQCNQYRDGVCLHKMCGCNVNKDRRFMNKLAWRSEHCPLGKW